MSSSDFLEVTLRKSLTGLERTLSLLRNQLLESPTISLASNGEDELHILLPLDGSRVSLERLVAELSALRDVREVRRIGTHGKVVIREIALAQISARDDLVLSGLRILTQDANNTVVEITGSPGDIDRILAEMRHKGVLLGAKRTGGITVG